MGSQATCHLAERRIDWGRHKIYRNQLRYNGFQKKNKVVLERFHFDRLGVKKDSARRALNRLQAAGLIEYTKDGRKYKVTILSVKSQADETAMPNNPK